MTLMRLRTDNRHNDPGEATRSLLFKNLLSSWDCDKQQAKGR